MAPSCSGTTGSTSSADNRRVMLPFLVRKSVRRVDDEGPFDYDEARDVAVRDGTPVVLLGAAQARTQTFTNVAQEQPDEDPSRAVRMAAPVGRTQTMTKAGGEAPDVDPWEPRRASVGGEGTIAATTRYLEDQDLTVGPDGYPLASSGGTSVFPVS